LQYRRDLPNCSLAFALIAKMQYEQIIDFSSLVVLRSRSKK
jgi:hypothetical protein